MKRGVGAALGRSHFAKSLSLLGSVGFDSIWIRRVKGVGDPGRVAPSMKRGVGAALGRTSGSSYIGPPWIRRVQRVGMGGREMLCMNMLVIATGMDVARKSEHWEVVVGADGMLRNDQAAVAELRETVRHQRVRIQVLGVDHEELAPRTVLPTESEVGTERVTGRAVLE